MLKNVQSLASPPQMAVKPDCGTGLQIEKVQSANIYSTGLRAFHPAQYISMVCILNYMCVCVCVCIYVCIYSYV